MFPLFIKFLHKKLLMLLPVTSLAKRGLQVSMGIPCPAGLTTHYCHYWTLSTYLLYKFVLQAPGDQTGWVWAGCALFTCSVSFGSDGVQSRYRCSVWRHLAVSIRLLRRFCTRDTYCRGAHVDTAACSYPAHSHTSPPNTLTSPQQEPRPTPVYGAALCECDCTYLLHTAAHAREINFVSWDTSTPPSFSPLSAFR